MKAMARPSLLGIVNITENSFSDGGRFLAPEAAIGQARALAAAGADIIDLGPASSHPDAAPVSAVEERRRLEPVISALKKDGLTLCVDSFLPETQAYALAQGVAYLNDIQGFPDPAHYPMLAASDCQLIVMHSIQGRGRATRAPAPGGDIFEFICRFFEARLGAFDAAGIARRRLILDPGMGFFLGNSPAASLQALRRLPELKERFGAPVLISVSRKSFLRTITGLPVEAIGPATLAAELYGALQGADFIRTHDTGALASALAVWDALDEG